MDHHTKRNLLCSLLAVLGAVSPVAAGAIDQLLQDIDFTAAGQGVSNAIVMIDGRLAKGDLAPTDRAQLVVRRIDFMTRTGPGVEKDFDGKRIGAAADLAVESIFGPGEVDPAVQLKAFDLLLDRQYFGRMPHKFDARMISIAGMALKNPLVARRPEARGAFLMRLGDLWAKRHCQDVALENYRAAAACYSDPAEKAAALFKGAQAARVYRDMKTSSALLDEVAKLEQAPYAVQKRALLMQGENAIFADEHSWTATPERVAEARKYVQEALSNRSPLVGTDEALRVEFAVLRAMALAGDPLGAIKIAEEMLEWKGARKIEMPERADIAVFIGDTYFRLGDYKQAVKAYDKGVLGGKTGPKDVHMRIAKAARLDQDFLRAMQAYSEAIKYCDPEEGKDEIAHLTRLVRQMNKSVRKGAWGFDSDAIFTDTNEDISGLSLDEE